jgi:adenylate cyclase
MMPSNPQFPREGRAVVRPGLVAKDAALPPKRRAGALLSRLVPDIRFGTAAYPEKVARRLSVLNFATWIVAATLVFYTIVRLLDPEPGRVGVAAVTAAFATVFACIPLLHRYGPWIGINVFLVVFMAYTFRVASLVGTGGGTHFSYIAVTGLAILMYGRERRLLAVLASVSAVFLIIAQQLYLPASTGFLPEAVLLKVNFVSNVVTAAIALFAIVNYATQRVEHAEEVTAREHARSEALLANIFPADVAARLKSTPDAEIADAFPEASILFADMAGYTTWASDITPGEVVHFLNIIYTRFDAIVLRHGLEKIKTTGDSYMAVSGVPVARPDHASALASLALDMRDAVSGLTDLRGKPVSVRIGLASGPVVAGVVGMHKYSYDVWGDAVNMASRMETTGEAGTIHVAPSTYELLKDQFRFVARDPIHVRGKGQMQTWFLVGPK